MLKVKVISNDELIKYLTKIEGKLPSNEYLVCITSTDENPIIASKYNILPVSFDNELYGPRVLSFSDAFRIFNLVRYKIMPDAQKLKEVTLFISCKDGLTQSGAIGEWVASYTEPSLFDTSFYEEKNLFIDPSQITLNKMHLVQMFVEQLVIPTENIPAIALKIVESEKANNVTKHNAEEYLNELFINEKKFLVRNR